VKNDQKPEEPKNEKGRRESSKRKKKTVKQAAKVEREKKGPAGRGGGRTPDPGCKKSQKLVSQDHLLYPSSPRGRGGVGSLPSANDQDENELGGACLWGRKEVSKRVGVHEDKTAGVKMGQTNPSLPWGKRGGKQQSVNWFTSTATKKKKDQTRIRTQAEKLAMKKEGVKKKFNPCPGQKENRLSRTIQKGGKSPAGGWEAVSDAE